MPSTVPKCRLDARYGNRAAINGIIGEIAASSITGAVGDGDSLDRAALTRADKLEKPRATGINGDADIEEFREKWS